MKKIGLLLINTIILAANAQNIVYEHPSVLYSSEDTDRFIVEQVRMNDEETFLDISISLENDSLVFYKTAYIAEDGGARHYIELPEGTDSIVCRYVDAKENNTTIRFQKCNNPNTASLDLYNGRNVSLLGIHDSTKELDIPAKEYRLDVTDDLFVMGDVEIHGHIENLDNADSFSVYCQHTYIYTEDTSREDRCCSVAEDGSFCIKFKTDHPGMVLLMLYDKNGSYHKGRIIASNIYIRPGDILDVSIPMPKNRKEIKIKNLNGGPDFSKCAMYNINYTEYTAYSLITSNEYAKGGKERLQNAYNKNLEVARYIISHYSYSETEAKLYLDELLFEYIAGLSLFNLKFLEGGADDNQLDYSYLKLLSPYDPGYLINESFKGAYGRKPHIFDSIRTQVYNECPDLSVADKERKILLMQNDALNQITGWTGLSYVMQAMYVHSMYKIRSSNGFRRLKDNETLNAIVKELNHPFFINAAKEIYVNEVLEPK